MNRRQFVTASCGLLTVARAFAAGKPSQVLVIRHADKSGSKFDGDLNQRGYQRAASLPRLFPSRFETPAFLFASRPARKSNRPVETVTPLAHALGLTIETRFADEDYPGLAKYVLEQPAHAGKTVLICWHHDRIPVLAARLGVAHAPSKWPAEEFDRVWRIEYLDSGVQFTNLPQKLLPGDSQA
jgi:hypothetical protein